MSLTFLYPWVLTGLLALPLIYLLLRIIPPAAKKISLPSLRFLHDLEQKNPPVQKTPWWILLLRLLMLALLILGLAHPVFNPDEQLKGSGPVLIVYDNGWAASQTWGDQQSAALRIAEQAKREKRPVKLVLTAPLAGETLPQVLPTDSADRVINQLKGLLASSWPGRPDLVPGALTDEEKGFSTYWISAGLAESGYTQILSSFKNLNVFIPPKNRYPMIMRTLPERDEASLGQVEAPTGMPNMNVQVRATDLKGQLVDQISVSVTGGQGYVDAVSKLPASELGSIAQVQIASRTGAGSIMLRDRSRTNNRIGLISAEAAKESYSLSSPAYYISRAVEPFAVFETGTVEDLLKNDPGMIVLADGGALPPKTLDQLTGWVRDGGILLRFATSALTQDTDTLTPVQVRNAERSLQGKLTWDEPLKIKSFSPSSPFIQLPVPTDITINRQVLAEPSPDLSDRTWVTLSDDTPLITASHEGKGLLVLVHTTATPEWSDLPLSGFYVEIFKSLSEMAARPDKTIGEGSVLHPLMVLNGAGQFVQPPANLKPVERSEFKTLSPSSLHPPGLYGTQEESFALNLGDHLPPLEPLATHASATQLISGSAQQELDATPFLLSAALVLFLADTLVLLAISGFMLKLRWILPLAMLVLPISATAAEDDAEMASLIHLAYIKTGDPILDQTSQQGLENLARDLLDRTAVEPGKVVGLTPGIDNFAFYPLIYWPISVDQPQLSDAASAALQSYIDHGGMILLDTRDGMFSPDQFATSAQITRMRSLLQTISLNPLVEAPEKHVFFRTFYLLNIYPELSLKGDIWIEENSLEDQGGVSSVVVTGRDWARVWASQPGAVPQSQKEQATRFGINAVMYALTGNYKTDQVHMNAILERLGQ